LDKLTWKNKEKVHTRRAANPIKIILNTLIRGSRTRVKKNSHSRREERGSLDRY